MGMLFSTALELIGGLQGAAAQQKELKARQAMANVQQQNARLDQVRQARIQQARILQAGANQGAGTTESSSVVTGASGVVGQAEANVGYIANQWNVSKTIFSAQRAQVANQGLVDLGKGIASLDQAAASVFASGG